MNLGLYLRRYLPFTKASFSVALAYRTHILLWIFTNILEIFMMVMVWVAVYSNATTSTLYGFTLKDIIFYNIIMTLTSSMVFMMPLWDVAEDYFDGKIAMSLIKPIDYKTMVFFKNIGSNIFRNVMISFPIIVIVAILPLLGIESIHPSVSQILWFILSIFLGLWINFTSNFIFSLLVFKTEATFGLFQLNEIILRIFSGALIPLAFFPDWIRTWILRFPYASIQSTPTLILLGRLEGFNLQDAFIWQVFWAISLGLLSQFLWRKSVQNLKVMGG